MHIAYGAVTGEAKSSVAARLNDRDARHAAACAHSTVSVVQRRASNTGVILVAGQKVALGRTHQHQTLSVLMSETALAIEFPDGDTKVVRRTTDQPVRSIKGQRPRTASTS
jgi:hypothetical protein